MSTINFASKEISLKVVYYGAGLSGKTTCLEQIHQSIPAHKRQDLVAIATEEERTLCCDFLPVQVGRLGPYAVRLQLFTVPGQVFYNSTRKLVLRGSDGVVFVADSQSAMRSQNSESMENLKANLAEWGQDLSLLPHVIQYNKRDLVEIQPIDFLNGELNQYGVPFFESVAAQGKGVQEPLYAVTRLILDDLRGKGMLADTGSKSQVTQLPKPPRASSQIPVVAPPPEVEEPRRAEETKRPEPPARRPEENKRAETARPPIAAATRPAPAVAAAAAVATGAAMESGISAAPAGGSVSVHVPVSAPIARIHPVGRASSETSQSNIVVREIQPPAVNDADLSFAMVWQDAVLRSEARTAEDLLRAGKSTEAVVKAAQLMNLAAQQAGHRANEEAMFVFLQGGAAVRYQRFRGLVKRALIGEPVTMVDALFAIHFVTEFAFQS